MKQKTSGAKKDRPCALCYGVLSDNENGIHDRHRDTDLGKQYLAQVVKPKLKVVPLVSSGGSKVRNPPSEWLTPKETEVLALLMEGYTAQEIAKKLGTTYSAVSSRITNAKKRVHAKTLYQMVAIVAAKQQEDKMLALQIKNADIGETEKKEEVRIEPLTHPNPAKRPAPEPMTVPEPVKVPVHEPELV